MVESIWTPSMVEERMAEAAATLKRLPPVRIQGYISTWPPIVRDACDAYGWSDVKLRLGPPSAAAIDRMDQALQWLPWLEPDDARLVWARADGMPWKKVCWKFGLSKSAAWRHWVVALCIVAMKLNGERIPRHRPQLETIALQRRRMADQFQRTLA